MCPAVSIHFPFPLCMSTTPLTSASQDQPASLYRQENCMLNGKKPFQQIVSYFTASTRSPRHDLNKLQSWTKVLRHFTETNAFKLTIIFCVWMKTSFSSVLLPPFPQPMLQTPHGCLFVSNIEKGGRGGYLSWWERGEFTPREKKLVIVVCVNDFCPWLLV